MATKVPGDFRYGPPPTRDVIKIDVGDIPPEEVQQQIEKVKAALKKKPADPKKTPVVQVPKEKVAETPPPPETTTEEK